MSVQETYFVGGPLNGQIVALPSGTRSQDVFTTSGFPLIYEPESKLEYDRLTYLITTYDVYNGRGDHIMTAHVGFAPGWK